MITRNVICIKQSSTQLCIFVFYSNPVNFLVHCETVIYIMYVDFSKVFDKELHDNLISELIQYRLNDRSII